MGEVGHMLTDSAWRVVNSGWEAQIRNNYNWMLCKHCWSECKPTEVCRSKKRLWRIVPKLRGRTAEWRVETGGCVGRES